MKTLPTDRPITYQKQYRKCGKSYCRCCKNGQLHGPYTYAYWHDDARRLFSKYIGKGK